MRTPYQSGSFLYFELNELIDNMWGLLMDLSNVLFVNVDVRWIVKLLKFVEIGDEKLMKVLWC